MMVIENTDTTEEAPQRMTNPEALDRINSMQKDYAELKRQRGTSDPAMRKLFEEFDEMKEGFIEWENRFVHQISSSVCTSAEASYVGEETARRCKWRVNRTQRKVVLTGTYGVVATGVVNVPVQIGNRTIERLQLFISPHVDDSLTLGRDVVSRISVREGRLLLTLYDGEVIDTLAEEPFRLLFDATYVEEEDWQIKEAEQLHDVHGMKNAVMIDQSHKMPEQGVASSILEDPTLIQVEESLQQPKGAEPRMWSTDRGALSTQSDVNQKGRRARISRPSRRMKRMRGLKKKWQGVPGLWGKSNLETRSLLTNGCTHLPF